MSARRLLAFLFLLGLGVSSAAAQNEQSIPTRRARFSIGGNVRDQIDHHPMESVQVVLKTSTGAQLSTTYTRNNGDFMFEALPNGDFTIEVAVKDYDMAREAVSIAGSSRMGISIFLNRSGKPGANTMGMSISAHQLSVPRKAHDEFEKGMALVYMKSDYRAAIAQFQLAIKDFPTYYEAYAEEGTAYYELQEMSPAEEALQKSVELSNGTYADALFTLAAIYTDTKRFAEAEVLARKGLAADSSSWRGPFELARALNALKRPEEAEKNAQQARDLMPDNAPVYLLLANIHIQRKDYPALLRDLDDYLRLSPYGPEADQARKTKDQVQAALNAQKAAAAGSGKNDSTDDDDDADSGAQKNSSSPAEPDKSGLPSLPPPTADKP
jgi:Carboxypeptidase regulatory-like domain/Tetratricopeptide repeat